MFKYFEMVLNSDLFFVIRELGLILFERLKILICVNFEKEIVELKL